MHPSLLSWWAHPSPGTGAEGLDTLEWVPAAAFTALKTTQALSPAPQFQTFLSLWCCEPRFSFLSDRMWNRPALCTKLVSSPHSSPGKSLDLLHLVVCSLTLPTVFTWLDFYVDETHFHPFREMQKYSWIFNFPFRVPTLALTDGCTIMAWCPFTRLTTQFSLLVYIWAHAYSKSIIKLFYFLFSL